MPDLYSKTDKYESKSKEWKQGIFGLFEQVSQNWPKPKNQCQISSATPFHYINNIQLIKGKIMYVIKKQKMICFLVWFH